MTPGRPESAPGSPYMERSIWSAVAQPGQKCPLNQVGEQVVARNPVSSCERHGRATTTHDHAGPHLIQAVGAVGLVLHPVDGVVRAVSQRGRRSAGPPARKGPRRFFASPGLRPRSGATAGRLAGPRRSDRRSCRECRPLASSSSDCHPLPRCGGPSLTYQPLGCVTSMPRIQVGRHAMTCPARTVLGTCGSH
jgi:hypothetical protein